MTELYQTEAHLLMATSPTIRDKSFVIRDRLTRYEIIVWKALTNCGVGGDPAVFNTRHQIVERKSHAVLGLFFSHGELGLVSGLL